MNDFATTGYLGPLSLLTREDCRRLLQKLRRIDAPLVPDWQKGIAVTNPAVFRVATLEPLLSHVRAILGNDIMLWGSSIVRSKPGQIHPWHNDIESSTGEGKTLSVWIGLEYTSRESSLQMISRSHHFRTSVQQVRHDHGVQRGKASVEEVLEWAKARDAKSEYIVPDARDGEAILFDGWLWHATWNTGKLLRSALLLQYATPDAPIRIPDPNHVEWPFRTLSHPKPPCIMISGSDRHGMNRIVPAPVTHDGVEKQVITTAIHALDLPLATEAGKPWKPYFLFRGATPNLQGLTCHASALDPGQTPHPPHQHREDEILLVLAGEADVTLPDLAKEGRETVVPMKPGDFVFYPAWFYHTITARGDQPASYLMFKWFNTPPEEERGDTLQYRKCSFSEHLPGDGSEKAFRTQLVYQGMTDCLARLHAHTTVLQPGGGYPAHIDAHDVAIVVMKGEVETLGTRSGPGSVLYFAGGQSHDMHNPGSVPAEYLVFEFHSNHPPAVRRRKRTLWQKALDPKSYVQKFNEIRKKLG